MVIASECSVFSAEAAAIFVAVTTPADRPLLILTDSASVLEALNSEHPKHPWVQGILAALPSSTSLAWVPGHCNVPGNDAADRLASVGHQGQRFTETIPLDDAKRWIKNVVWNHWASVWDENRSAQLRKTKATVSRWEELDSLHDQKVLSLLRVGHTRLSHNFGPGPFRISCDSCGILNSVEHVICVCPQYRYPREAYGISGNINEALGNDPSAIGALFSFLKDAGLYNLI